MLIDIHHLIDPCLRFATNQLDSPFNSGYILLIVILHLSHVLFEFNKTVCNQVYFAHKLFYNITFCVIHQVIKVWDGLFEFFNCALLETLDVFLQLSHLISPVLQLSLQIINLILHFFEYRIN